MLKYTGHPLIDVGIATITAFVNKPDPTLVTEDDLNEVADYIEREYVRQPLKSFLTVAFTSNAWFNQYAYNPDRPGITAEKRKEIQQTRDTLANYHLRQWAAESETSVAERDVFVDAPAIAVELSGRLLPGRAGRAQVPLAVGDECINFYANGIPGLPVSGKTMLALQAFPLGCAKCGGRLLAVHSDNTDIIFRFAKKFLEGNRRAIGLAQQAKISKMQDAGFSQKTLLIDTLIQASDVQYDSQDDIELFSITAYHLTNSGQGAGLDIYHLPLQIIGFLQEMYQASYKQEWQAIVSKAWETPPKTKSKRKSAEPFQPRRNWLYEDLFSLPENARRFLRTYFLRLAVRYARGQSDPRIDYSLKDEANLVSWKITARFLRRIMNMDKEQVEEIRKLGDRLAEYVAGMNDRRFFRNFFVLQRYGDFRTVLIKANIACVKSGKPPIITLDPYIQVFEDGTDLARPDWRLARDLVLIRMIEQLYQQGWLGSNIDALPEESEETEESTEE